jgi:two-component SAPR family response regulator
MEQALTFIIIDDDSINNFICKEFIKFTIKVPHVVLDFTSPEKALNYIVNEYSTLEKVLPITLFLDINMPTMSGWEFLEQFGLLDEKIKSMFSVFMISSSINPRDREQAFINPYVKDFTTKPVTEDFLTKHCA